MNGEIQVNKFQIEKPLIGMVNNIEKVTIGHKVVVDLDDTKFMNENRTNLTYHWINWICIYIVYNYNELNFISNLNIV